MCKSEADRPLDLTNPFSSVVQFNSLRSPPIREAESAIGVLRTALGKCKSEAERSESAIGVLKTSPKTLAGSRDRLAT